MAEPKVTFSNIDETLGLGVDPVDTRLNILCPVLSPAGPTELTRVSGPSEFKRLYFGGASISASNDTTAKFARALTNHAPIWIKRGVRTGIMGGFTSGTQSTIYVDDSLNPIEGMKLSLAATTASANVDTALSAWTTTQAITETDDTVFCNFNGNLTGKFGTLNDNTFTALNVNSGTVLTTSINTGLSISGELGTQVSVKILNTIIVLPSDTTNLNSIYTAVVAAGIYPDAVVVDDVTAITNKLVNLDTVLASSVKIVSIGWANNISITFSGTSASLTKTCAVSQVNSCKLKTDEEYINGYPLGNSGVSLTIDGVVYNYYTGTPGTIPEGQNVQLSDATTFSKFMQALIRELDSFNCATAAGNSIVVPGCTAAAILASSTLTLTTSVLDSTSWSYDKFAIVSKFPCSSQMLTMVLEAGPQIAGSSPIEYSYYIARITYAGIEEEWKFGFNEDAVDGYGVSLYYTRVNEESDLIKIVMLDGSSLTFGTKTFGSEVTADYCGVPEIVDAYSNMVETEESPVVFDYITDGGIVGNSSLASQIYSMCNSTYQSFYPMSCPDTNSITSMMASKTLSTPKTNYIAVTQVSSAIDIGTVVLPGSYWYLSERINYANTSEEFRPLYGTEVSLSIVKPRQKFTTAQRETLLANQIPSMKRNPSTGGWYLNLDSTTYATDSYLQDTNISLMVNKIAQTTIAYAKEIPGQNVVSGPVLWKRVTEQLGTSLKSRMRVTGSESASAPGSITVVCNSSNNPPTLQAQSKLQIDVYSTFGRSIKEVLVYSHIQPLLF